MTLKEMIPVMQEAGKITRLIPVMRDAKKISEVIPDIPDIDKEILEKSNKKTFNRIKLSSVLFSILVLVILVFTIVNYSIIQERIDEGVAQQVNKYGYTFVFVAAFLVEILPQPFVSAIMPFTSGFILGLNFATLLIILLIGAISSNYVAYYLGIRYGKKISISLVGEENYLRSFDLFKKYGKAGITLFALTPLPYFPILGGIFKMNFYEFTIYAIIPRIFHFLIFSFIVLSLFG